MYEVQKRPDDKVLWVGLKQARQGEQYGHFVEPLLTLVDVHETRLQIVEDDHQYVLLVRRDEETYTSTPWWPPEAIDALAQYRSPRGIGA